MTEVGRRVSYHQGRISIATKAWVERETIKTLRDEMSREEADRATRRALAG